MLTRLLFGFASMIVLAITLIITPVTDPYTYEGETPGTLTAIGDAGSPNVFTFERWHFADVQMPENDPRLLQATIEIDITSMVTDWKELEESIKKKKDYFFVKKFPTASVIINGATLLEDGSYTTDAMLSLKGVERPVSLTFQISDEAPYTVEGTGVIQRRDFKFTGGGPKEEVPIAFSCTLPLTD